MARMAGCEVFVPVGVVSLERELLLFFRFQFPSAPRPGLCTNSGKLCTRLLGPLISQSYESNRVKPNHTDLNRVSPN